jgi:uroporphyrinogen-III synthase
MIVYLGLDPSRYIREGNLLHHPLIATKKLITPGLSQAKEHWPFYSHVIFTSQTAVRFWFEEVSPGTHQVLAVGSATASALRKLGIEPLVAREETQEGIMALLEDLEIADILWPKSSLARSDLETYLQQRKCSYFAFDLYTTEFLTPPKITDWSAVTEIVFTSPSTVRAFLQLYGEFPKQVRLTAIGPVTLGFLRSFVYNPSFE